jgi:DNA topoisomerase-1
MKVYVNINGHSFHFSGRRILVHGWTRYYEPYVKFDEVLLPPMKKGQIVNVKKTILEHLFTEQPRRYNPSSLLKDMEEARIGTKATRADIIQMLYDRRYIEGERMTVTSLGFEVFDVMEKNCAQIVSTALTRELEERMTRIRENKEKREDVLTDVIEMLRPSLAALKEEEKVVGEQLNNTLERSKLERSIIDSCPVCKTGKLIINYSRKTGKRFVGCTSYFKGLCKACFALPKRGTVEPMEKTVPHAAGQLLKCV